MSFFFQALVFSIGFTLLCRLLWSNEPTERDKPVGSSKSEPQESDGIRPRTGGPPHLSVTHQNQNESGRETGQSVEISNLAKLILTALAIAGFFWSTYVTGWINSADEMVATFTVVLSAIAMLQWWITREQIRQTDDVIRHMRNEQRPWLAIIDPVLNPSGVANQPDFCFRFENSGTTPGTVLGIRLMACVIPDIHADGLPDALANIGGPLQRAANVVPPKSGCNHSHKRIDLTEYGFESMAEDDGWLCIVGMFPYLGPEGDVYRTGFAFAFRADGKLRVAGDYRNNYMV
jgi:hypothetical protein